MQPLVSILIPCFNAERWIAQCIESALSQTWSEKEVIVVDDGSTDGSLEIIKRYADRIRFEGGPNCGANVARNRLLEMAGGEWLQYLDADDYLLPNKVRRQLEVLEDNLSADVIFSPVMLDESLMAEGHVAPRSDSWCIPTSDMWIALARWRIPQTGGLIIRRQALVDIAGWKATQPCCQDNELCLRLLMKAKRFVYCPVDGAVYRIGDKRTVSSRDKPLVRQHRLEILQSAEGFLRASHALSKERLTAINQTRFEIARIAWLTNPSEATQIVDAIHHVQPDFLPRETAPMTYRLLYNYFGFRFAQLVADLRRSVKSAVPVNGT